MAYNELNVRMWAYRNALASTNDGWGNEINMEYNNAAGEVRVVSLQDTGVHPTQYDSGWVQFSSQAGTSSYREFAHSACTSSAADAIDVNVMVRSTGANNGYIFSGAGMAPGDDDSRLAPSGVVFAYNRDRVRIWAPDRNNDRDSGRIFRVNDHFGADNTIYREDSNTANVRVLVRCVHPHGTPDYDSGWFLFQSQQGSNSYRELTHNLGGDAAYLRVQVLITPTSSTVNNYGYYFQGVGSAQQDDDGGTRAHGGVVFAYSSTKVRLWTPDKNNDGRAGKILFVDDGWGGEFNTIYSDTANVRVKVWRTTF